MRVTMMTTAASPSGVLHYGRTYNLPDSLAKEFLAAKAATEASKEDKVEQIQIARDTDE